MSEPRKTTILLALGAVSLLAAWIARPAAPTREAVDDSGERFFAEFDPLDVTSLEITAFDAEAADLRSFQVAKRDGVWSIPSQEGYPADAETQMAAAAAAVVDLVKGPSVSESPADHALYGVLDPERAELGAAGAGTRVRMVGPGNAVLADLIVGGAVKDQAEVRYVRSPDRDRVYLARLDTTALSTKFEDWIERDLLQLDPSELTEVVVNEYSIDELNSRLVQGDVLRLAYEASGATWSLEGLAETEALDDARLGELRTALDDLEIVDVRRKPAGLSRELAQADDLQLDAEAVRSLSARGFYIHNGQLLSNEGETQVTTRTGVTYQLRFGQITSDDRSVGSLSEPQPEPTPEPSDSGLNRYLFVTVTFRPDAVPEPPYEPLPEERTAEAGEGETDAVPDGDAPDTTAAETDRIRQANERLRTEYERTLQEGRETVETLNRRFADWYYVISDDVYRKIRLSRTDIVQENAETSERRNVETGE